MPRGGWVGCGRATCREWSGGLAGEEAEEGEVAALVSAWQCGAVSRETLLYQLERGELMRPGATAEDEARKVAADMPPGLVAAMGKAKAGPAGG